MITPSWVKSVQTAMEARAKGIEPRFAGTEPDHPVEGVLIGWRYPRPPAASLLALDLLDVDLALRRSALSVTRELSLERVQRANSRTPRESGLRVTGGTPGSLDLLTSVPVWILAALASNPATALANLASLLQLGRVGSRIALRHLGLSPSQEREIREILRPPDLEDVDDNRREWDDLGDVRRESKRTTGAGPPVPLEGHLPADLRGSLEASPAVTEIEVEGVRVRTNRPDIDVGVLQQGGVTVVSVRTPDDPAAERRWF